MDLGVDLAGATRIADEATASANGLSQAVEDASRAGAELVAAAEGAPEVAGLVDAILSDWSAGLNGAMGQAAYSAERLRAGILAFALADEHLAEDAAATSPSATRAGAHGRTLR